MKHFETIQEFNDMLGVETLHPLVSVVNLSEARPMQHMRHTNGFYSVMLKAVKADGVKSVVCLTDGKNVPFQQTAEGLLVDASYTVNEPAVCFKIAW